jgi:hypothetical protein
MTGTLRALLGARAAAVVGRQAERAVLLDLVERDRPLVAAVHGIAGIGKSALLAAFAEDARAHGAAVVCLDCGGIEPTERGFLTALDRAIGALRAEPPGGTRPMATVAHAAAALSVLGGRVVLVLDTYEQLRLLDTWLRQEFVPGLRDNTRLALAGREPPVAAWISDFGDLLAMVPLANLAAVDADALLRREGLSGADVARVTRFTHGHPLALRLAASARGARPDLTVPDAAVATVVTELARVYLSGLDEPTREVLDAACTLRRPTLSLLGALLPDVPPNDAYDRLRPLPFVAFGPDGLVLHDTVREVVAALLRVNDPPAYRAYRIAAWRQLRRELRSAPPGDLWRYTADLLYLIENPAVREAFFPTASYRYAVEPARPADEAQITAIARAHQSAGAVAMMRSWWDTMPSAFRVARDADGSAAAFQCLCEAGSVPTRLLAADPVTAVWREHLRVNPVPRGQQVLFLRHMLAADGGEAATPAHAALILDRLPCPLQRLRAILHRRLADRPRRAGNAHRQPRLAGSWPPPAHPRRNPCRSHQARIRRPSVPARTRRPDRQPGGAAARRMGLRLERRQQRRRGRDQRPAPQARRPRRKPADSARRRLPLHRPALTPARIRRPLAPFSQR